MRNPNKIGPTTRSSDFPFQHRSIEREPSLAAPPELDEIAAAVCVEYGINEEELAAPTQRRDLSEARALFGWLVNDLGAGTLTQVAARCHRDLSSLSSGVQRLLARAEGDLTVVTRMKRLRSGW